MFNRFVYSAAKIFTATSVGSYYAFEKQCEREEVARDIDNMIYRPDQAFANYSSVVVAEQLKNPGKAVQSDSKKSGIHESIAKLIKDAFSVIGFEQSVYIQFKIDRCVLFYY